MSITRWSSQLFCLWCCGAHKNANLCSTLMFLFLRYKNVVSYCQLWNNLVCIFHLQSCIKVALDFVSPESIHECIRLADEFRALPRNHVAKEDKLEVYIRVRIVHPKLIGHGWSSHFYLSYYFVRMQFPGVSLTRPLTCVVILSQ